MYYKYFKLTMCSSLFSVFFHNVNKLVLRIATGQSTMGGMPVGRCGCIGVKSLWLGYLANIYCC